MQTGRCINCHQLFRRRPQNKEQSYCSQKPCQRARKTNWERQKVSQRSRLSKEPKSQSEGLARKPPPIIGKVYRKKHPAQAERNRELQLIRNAKQRGYFVEQLSMKTMPAIPPLSLKSFSLSSVPIAKTDASIPYQFCLIASSDEDLIAKMDASNPSSAQIFKAFVQLPLIAKMDA